MATGKVTGKRQRSDKGGEPYRAFSLLRLKSLGKGDANDGMFGETLTRAIIGNHSAESVNQCVISNMMIDGPWLLSATPSLRSSDSLSFVVMSNPEALKADVVHFLGQLASGITVETFAPSVPYRFGSHHSKFTICLLKNRTVLRLAVFTANFIKADCSFKTQAVYSQDFHLKGPESSSISSDFECSLTDYLRKLNPPSGSMLENVANSIAQFDFSTATADLVPSIPGRHSNSKYGSRKIASVMNSSRSTKSSKRLSCVVSSIGSLKEENINDLECAFGCERGSLSIGWPSVSQVTHSIEGLVAGQSLPVPLKNVNASTVAKRLHMFDASHIARERAMPHIKAFGSFKQSETTDKSASEMTCVMISSANLSNAALGREVKKDGSFEVMSYELGVLFTPESAQGNLFAVDPTSVKLGHHDVNVPFPTRQPPDRFYSKESDCGELPFAVDRLPNLPGAHFYGHVEKEPM
jgi:tyrosyl-DNA phosphodiesterase-1